MDEKKKLLARAHEHFDADRFTQLPGAAERHDGPAPDLEEVL